MALISAGWTYKFVFLQKFASLNGVYTLSKIYSWAEVLNEQLSIFELLYAPLNIPEAEYNDDIKQFVNGSVYKLVSPIDGNTIYAPEGILSHLPIYPVKEYQDLVMLLPLGVFDSIKGLDYITSQITEELKGALGISNAPRLTSVGKTYLTEKEYNELADGRQARVDRILNWFAAYSALKEENNFLKAQIEGYQKMLNDVVGG